MPTPMDYKLGKPTDKDIRYALELAQMAMLMAEHPDGKRSALGLLDDAKEAIKRAHDNSAGA